MPLGSYLVNFGPFDLIFDLLWGFSVKIAYWNLGYSCTDPNCCNSPLELSNSPVPLKGGYRNFFYLFKVFIGPKLRQVSIGNFHRKAPKLVKHQAKGSKIHKIRTKCHPTYWGNPPILSSELLGESINSVIRPAGGIHLLAISAFNLLGESTNSFIRATGGIHQFFHPTYCGNPFQYVFQSGGCLSIMSTISGLLLLDLLLFKSHVVSICLRVQLSNFGH